MLRSLALPFTVMEWALPPVPRSAAAAAASARKSTLLYRDRPTIASAVAAANAPLLSPTSPSTSDSLQESESAESFAFALVNGSLGVFEMRGRRVRDFKYNFCTNAIRVFFVSLSCYLILQHCLNLTK
jgi:hypothetical protein